MAAPVVIGGNGYRWRGRSIRTIRKDNTTCVTMPRADSCVMAPVSVIKNIQYKVTIRASKNSGNGVVLVNFFGGKAYDGAPVKINITGPEVREYTVAVAVPEYPKSLPMYLRVWKPSSSTGTVFIHDIRFEIIGGRANIPKEPRLERVPSRHKLISEMPKPKKRREKKKSIVERVPPSIENKEDDEMKFKPYDPEKTITTEVKKVLVSKPEDVPKVSIITLTRDGEKLLEGCYKALDANTSYPNWEWIIGDSESEDNTVEMVKAWKDPRVKLVERKTTEGSFSSINNEMVEYATGDYLLFLNNDTEPQKFWLYEMMSKIHNKDNVGMVGSRLLYEPGKVQHAGIAFIPNGPANIGKAVLKSFPDKFETYDRSLQAVTGACFLMRKEDFKAVDGFDPIYYFCYEDVDLCLKVKYNLGKEVIYAANSIVHHLESVTQKKHKTGGEKQKIGIQAFKERWIRKAEQDFMLFQKHNKGVKKVDISFVTCVNNIPQYCNLVVGSLFKNKTDKNYEIIPILNFGNKYSASQALNIGIDAARADIVVLCHQDVLFYQNWIETLFERIGEIEKETDKKWGVLGTAGISKKDDTAGVVHNMKGGFEWHPSKKVKYYPVQTVDEHCMIIKKKSGLRFDEKTFDGFHLYGPDICLSALDRGMVNYGIVCPLVHDTGGGSLATGKRDFMRQLNALADKWRSKFPTIRTSTSIVRKRSVRTFLKFKRR